MAQDTAPLAISRLDELAGTVLDGRYRLTRLAEHDQVGAVYVGEDLVAGSPCLLRICTPAVSKDPGFRARLRQRAQLATALSRQCPAIPAAVVSEGSNGLLLLASDPPSGRRLSDLLHETRGPSGAALGLRLAILGVRVGQALEAVHGAGLAHGHLGPHHVEVRDTDDVVLRGLELGALSPGLLERLDLAAPPFDGEYLATGQRAGQEPTESADIYAFGLLLRRLLAARDLHSRAGGRSGRLGRLADRFGGPSGRPVVRMIQESLAADPAHRPREVAAMVNELWAALVGPAARGADRAPGWRRWSRAVLVALGLVIATPLAWMLGTALTVPGRPGPPAAPPDPAPSAEVAVPALTPAAGLRLSEPAPEQAAPVSEETLPARLGRADRIEADTESRATREASPSPPAPPTVATPPPEPGSAPRIARPSTATVRKATTTPAGPATAESRRPGGAAEPRPAGGDRPADPRRPGDQEPTDPTAIIDWLVEQSRSTSPRPRRVLPRAELQPAGLEGALHRGRPQSRGRPRRPRHGRPATVTRVPWKTPQGKPLIVKT